MRPAAIVRSEQPRQTDRQLLEAGHRRLVSSVLTQEVRRQHVIIRRGQPHLWPRDSCEGGYRCGEEQRDQYLRRKSPEPGMTVWPCVGPPPLLTSNDGQWLWAPGGCCQRWQHTQLTPHRSWPGHWLATRPGSLSLGSISRLGRGSDPEQPRHSAGSLAGANTEARLVTGARVSPQ